MSNLYKINNSKWQLYVNQTKNATHRLDLENDYTSEVYAVDDAGNVNSTGERSYFIGQFPVEFIASTGVNATNLSQSYFETNTS